MSDIDKDLKRRLAAFADQISPEPGRSALVARGARRKRRLVALSAGVAVLLAIGGLAGATTLLGNRDGIKPAPGPDDMAAARYFFEVGSRDASASGVLEVNPREGTLCYEAITENIQASHLLRNTGVVAGGRRFEQTIVVTFFDADDREQGAELPSGAPICFQQEQLGELEDDLQALIDHPEEFRVDFHRGPEDEPGLIAELTPQGEAGVHEVESFAASLFKDNELTDTVPAAAGFSLRRIIRNGPDETNHDYATVGVQMEGAVSYARAIFFVHPTRRDAAEMGFRRSEALTLNWKTQRDGSAEVVKPFAVSNALPGTTCGSEPHLVACHASLGRVTVLTQSTAGAGDAEISDAELEAATTLIRSFGSYLERVYREHNTVADCPVTTPSDSAFVPPEPYPPRPPDLYQKEWYGSARLWTWIDSNGEVWQDLPDEDGDGRFSEKTFWWSRPVGDRRLAPITVRGRRLDGAGLFRTRASGGGGFREDIGSFMLVGIEIPAGCWELTGTYRGAELSYVVLVKDQP